MQKDNRLAWGISLLVFGFIFLFRHLNIFPPSVEDIIFDLKNYLLVLGVIFLFAHNNKNIGIVLIVLGLLFRLSDIIRWTQHISDIIWPFLLIFAGVIVIFGNMKKKN